jgi:uncharacterized membrane protein YccC
VSFAILTGWLGALGTLLDPAGLAHLGLGFSVAALAGAWLWSRRSLASVRSRTGELVERLETQGVRLAELERARWAADPAARARRDDELVQMLGSLLSYTESVRNGGAPAAPDQEGVEPCA